MLRLFLSFPRVTAKRRLFTIIPMTTLQLLKKGMSVIRAKKTTTAKRVFSALTKCAANLSKMKTQPTIQTKIPSMIKTIQTPLRRMMPIRTRTTLTSLRRTMIPIQARMTKTNRKTQTLSLMKTKTFRNTFPNAATVSAIPAKSATTVPATATNPAATAHAVRTA